MSSHLQECDYERDFRAAQCEEYNSGRINGQFFSWKPYYGSKDTSYKGLFTVQEQTREYPFVSYRYFVSTKTLIGNCCIHVQYKMIKTEGRFLVIIKQMILFGTCTTLSKNCVAL